MTNNNKTTTETPEGLEAVMNYLQTHPKIFVDHPHLLSEIIIPHQTGAATSLVERQVSVLREQLRQSKNQLKELIQIATENSQLSDRLHILAGKLVASDDLQSLLKTIRNALISDFKADKIVLRLFTQQPDTENPLPEFTGDNWPQKSLFSDVMKNKKPICGRMKPDQHQLLFGKELPEYGSSVLVPLYGKDWTGILAIGSQNPERYRKDMGTEILAQMADIVTLSLNACLR